MNSRRHAVSSVAVLACLLFLSAAIARADIVKLQSTQACQATVLATSPSTSQSKVYCAPGNQPLSLKGVLNGTIALYVGNSTTPSWNVINDTGSALTSLTLYYSGALASNASIDMQLSGTTIFAACQETTATNHSYSDVHCGTGDIAPAPVALPLKMVWSGGLGVAIDGKFNIGTSSFAHAGADAGCISGTATCRPVPEPSSFALFASALAAFAGIVRKRK